MVSGHHKSGTFRRVKLKLPGGRSALHFEKRKPKQAHCSVTGQVLHGTPRARPVKMRNMPKTYKRPQRPYGGVLSSQAARRIHIQKARSFQSKEE